MECTIGWVKTKDGYILFKNRDFFTNYKLQDALFMKDKVIGIQHINFWGYSAGINEHGVGIVVAGSGFDGMTKKKPIRMWPICKYALENSKTAKTAKEIVAKEFLKQKPTEGGNTIIADRKTAFVLENTGHDIEVQRGHAHIYRTNHFILLKNKYPLSVTKPKNIASLTRYQTITNFFEKNNPRKVDNIIKALKNHDPSKGENSICRHGKQTKTISSIIFKLQKRKISVYFCLNGNPCENKYDRIELQL